MHGTRWLPRDAPAELARIRSGATPDILIHRGAIADDEVCLVQSIDCTTAARTAYDIGRRTPVDAGVIRIDALLNATRCTTIEVEQIAARYPGARGIRRLRHALDLVDGGAESPQETRLRLRLVRAGLIAPACHPNTRQRRCWPGRASYRYRLARVDGRRRVRRQTTLDRPGPAC